MSEKPIRWQVKTVSLVEAIDAANKLNDAVVFVGMALEQLQGHYEINSESHRVTLLLQAAQDILEVELKAVQRELNICQRVIRENR